MALDNGIPVIEIDRHLAMLLDFYNPKLWIFWLTGLISVELYGICQNMIFFPQVRKRLQVQCVQFRLLKC